MKRIFMIALCCLMLVGCGNGAVEATVPETSMPEGITEYYLTVYAPSEDATGFIYASREVPDYSAESICTALVEAGVLNEDVKFNSLVLESGVIKLDVNEAFRTQLCSYGTAGEYMMMGSVVNTLLGPYSAETVSITCEGEVLESGHEVYDYSLEFYQAQERRDLKPMVMVDGKLYHATGQESSVEARCGMMDGTITSQVELWQEPTENDQSNFGSGYGYQYGPEPGTIEVNIDGSWYVYAASEEN